MSSTDSADAVNELVNLRDLGGMPTGDGALTRPGVVYRSDAPHAGDRDPEGMPQWPPAAVIDLREGVEVGEVEHPLAAVSAVHHLPLLEDVAEAESADDYTTNGLITLYANILDHAPKKLVEAFRIVLDTDGPVLVHCAVGKDRTGVLSALLLSAAGVRRDAIVADYVRTDENMMRVMKRLNLEAQLPPGVNLEAVMELMSAPTEAIESVLERFAEHPDGAAGWLRAHGATETELRRWRARFLDAA